MHSPPTHTAHEKYASTRIKKLKENIRQKTFYGTQSANIEASFKRLLACYMVILNHIILNTSITFTCAVGSPYIWYYNFNKTQQMANSVYNNHPLCSYRRNVCVIPYIVDAIYHGDPRTHSIHKDDVVLICLEYCLESPGLFNTLS